MSLLSGFLLFPAILIMSNFGITLPNQAPPDPTADAARFEAVSKHLDPGGPLYAYISVDGDLTAIGALVGSTLDEVRKVDPKVPFPPVDVSRILEISGMDEVSAVGFSSKRIENGFRNKTYIHAPGERQGLLRIMGDKSKPFDVVRMAPEGTDVAIQQDLNLKVVQEVVQEVFGMVMGDKGKAMVQGMLKRPLGPFPFTLEKVLADSDTRITMILDADPTKKVKMPKAKGLEIPQLQAVITIDGLGWVADQVAETLEKELEKKKGRRAPPFAFVRNKDWVGMQLSTEAVGLDPQHKEMLNLFGGEGPLLAHHRPSGKLILTTDKKFAEKLFTRKVGLLNDPAFKKTMKDLPMEGTTLSYVSPAFFQMLRDATENVTSQGKPGATETLIMKTMWDLMIPSDAQGEGSVTTSSKDGILVVSNSAHSHKSKLVNPLFMGGLPALFLGLKKSAYRSASELEAVELIPSQRTEEVLKDVGHSAEE
jgi:hypothetical protein